VLLCLIRNFYHYASRNVSIQEPVNEVEEQDLICDCGGDVRIRKMLHHTSDHIRIQVVRRYTKRLELCVIVDQLRLGTGSLWFVSTGAGY